MTAKMKSKRRKTIVEKVYKVVEEQFGVTKLNNFKSEQHRKIYKIVVRNLAKRLASHKNLYDVAKEGSKFRKVFDCKKVTENLLAQPYIAAIAIRRWAIKHNKDQRATLIGIDYAVNKLQDASKEDQCNRKLFMTYVKEGAWAYKRTLFYPAA